MTASHPRAVAPWWPTLAIFALALLVRLPFWQATPDRAWPHSAIYKGAAVVWTPDSYWLRLWAWEEGGKGWREAGKAWMPPPGLRSWWTRSSSIGSTASSAHAAARAG